MPSQYARLQVSDYETISVGEPVTVDGQLVGVTRQGDNMVAWDEARVIHHTDCALFSAILADVNAKGGPGAGFSPIPA